MGIDRDEVAVATARKVVSREGLDHRVTIENGLGENVDCSGFAAVWVSLHVHPREEVLHNCLASLQPGGRLVARNVAGLLRLLYRCVSPTRADLCARVRSAPAGARRSLVTVVAEKLPSPHEARVLLSALATGDRGIIAATNNSHPLLEPLGIRPGRRICVRCMQKLGGSIVADLEGRRVAIDRSLAGEIFVVPEAGD